MSEKSRNLTQSIMTLQHTNLNITNQHTMNEPRKSTLKPVRPLPEKGCPIYKKPRARHPPSKEPVRPPWDNTVHNPAISTVLKRKKSCTTEKFQLPEPDYECVPAEKYTMTPDSRRMTYKGHVVVCREPYRVAPWCRPKDPAVNVKRCVIFGDNSRKEVIETEPNNYRIAYVDERKLDNPEDRFQRVGKDAILRYCPGGHSGADTVSPERSDMNQHMAPLSLHLDHHTGQYSLAN